MCVCVLRVCVCVCVCVCVVYVCVTDVYMMDLLSRPGSHNLDQSRIQPTNPLNQSINQPTHPTPIRAVRKHTTAAHRRALHTGGDQDAGRLCQTRLHRPPRQHGAATVDGWMDGWVMDGWMDGWMDGCVCLSVCLPVLSGGM
jgi:hypothetical protein